MDSEVPQGCEHDPGRLRLAKRAQTAAELAAVKQHQAAHQARQPTHLVLCISINLPYKVSVKMLAAGHF